MYPLLHSPATYGRPRLLVVAGADDLPACGAVVTDATRHALRTFVLCLARGMPLPGSGVTHAVLPEQRERDLRAVGGRLGADRFHVTGYCSSSQLADLVGAHVDRVRPAVVVTRAGIGIDTLSAAIRSAAHRPAASYVLTGVPPHTVLTEPDGTPAVDPWKTLSATCPKEAS